MYRLREKLLARAALSKNQHAHIMARDPAGLADGILHDGRLPDDVPECKARLRSADARSVLPHTGNIPQDQYASPSVRIFRNKGKDAGTGGMLGHLNGYFLIVKGLPLLDQSELRERQEQAADGLSRQGRIHAEDKGGPAVDGGDAAVAVQHDDAVIHHFNERLLLGQQFMQTELLGNMLGCHADERNRMMMEGFPV